MANGNGGPGPIRVARPIIAVDGQDRAALSEGLLSLAVVEHTTGLYRCEAVFGNWGSTGGNIGFLHFDRSLLDFGKAFSIKLGSDSVFDGRVMALEGLFPDGRAPRLGILAEDRFQDLRMTRRSRTFLNMTDAAVFDRIAGEHGLTGSVSVSGPTHKVLAQVNQSDLAFVRERARAIDAEVWVEGRTLHAASHASRRGAGVRLTYGGGLREFSVLADLAGQRTSVTVAGWDVDGKAALQHDADDSVVSGELNGDSSGASVLAAALGTRKDAVVHTVPLTAAETQAQAEAFFRATARRFLTGRGIAEADRRLRAGASVDLQGLGPLFSGTYYLTEVRLLFDGLHGVRTEFTAERPGLGHV